MSNFIHHLLLLFSSFVFLYNTIYAQEMQQEALVRSRIPATVLGVESIHKINNTVEGLNPTSLPEKRDVKAINVSTKKNVDSILPINGNNSNNSNTASSKQINNAKFLSTKENTILNDRNQKGIIETETQKLKALEVSIFPDLKAIGVKETPYSNTFASAENQHKQLERLTTVPADNTELYTPGFTKNTNTSMSPLKRKYLEGVIADTEKEIASGQYSSLEVKAKKKEIEELKILLSKP